MKFAFISRHKPTNTQYLLAEAAGIDLIPAGDADAFSITNGFVDSLGAFDGVVVVHPATALRLASDFLIGVFENANRTPEGEKPTFEAVNLHVYDLRD